jgi:predicted cupin superfamily sugar epimerase
VNLRTRPTAEEIEAMLGLEPHPTCGFVAETYRSTLKIPGNALPEAYEGDRPCGSALYFLVTPEAQIVMHRIRSDQLYHHYLGASLEVLLLYPDGNGEVVSVGSNLDAGERPQLFLPGAPSTSRAWHRGPTTPCSRARSGTARRRARRRRGPYGGLPELPRRDPRLHGLSRYLPLLPRV